MALHQAFIETNGIRLNITQAGSGTALVFLHGLGWDHLLWAAAFSRYASRFHVIAGDTRGHGASDAPPGPYSIRQFAEDWRGVLDVLGVAKACLVGLSQGAMVAMQLATDQPKRINGLFLAAAPCRVDPPPSGAPLDLCRQLGAYDGPCTVVAGRADALANPSAVLEVAASIPGARFERVDESGHMIPVEQPDRFYALLDTFLEHPSFA